MMTFGIRDSGMTSFVAARAVYRVMHATSYAKLCEEMDLVVLAVKHLHIQNCQ